MNISSAFRTAKNVITANSPVLLVGTAVAGVITTGVLAAKGGYKARGILDEAQAKRDQEENSTPLTLQEKVQLTWLCYAAPAVTGASTIASVVGVHTIHTKRHAALAGLYAVTTSKLDDYREKAEELLGPKKTQELNNAIGQKAVDRDPLADNREVIITGEGNELCYDEWAGRWFLGSVPSIERAVAEVNTQLVEDGDASLNDFYDRIGLPPTQMGSSFGWSGTKIGVRFGSTTASDGRSAVAIWFHEEPKKNMGVS